MFSSFFRKKDRSKKQEQATTSSAANLTISTYVPTLKKILDPISEQRVLDTEASFIQQIKTLPNNLKGVHAAYYFLNDYVLRANLQQLEMSATFRALLPQLEELHEMMLNDPALNWYGVPKPRELQKSTQIYKGEMQYNQRMEYFLTDAAEKINHAIKQFPADMDAVKEALNADFLHHYVAGKLSQDEIALLDHAEAMMRQHEIDFLTVQTSLQLYRYIIANKEKSANNADFIASRSGLIPVARELTELASEELLARIERYLPPGEIKDYYEASRSVSIIDKPATAEFQLNMNANMRRKLPVNDAFTPMAEHYKKYMDAILSDLDQDSLQLIKTGALPFYPAEGGQLLESKFEKIQYPEPFMRHNKPGIWNTELPHMVPALREQEKYPGENLYLHLKRLYTISMLTTDPAVREEARTRMEWWYSNIMPFYRGSAAISEGLSKLPLLTHNIRPTQMIGRILPDLGAICQYSEEDFFQHHDEFYAPHHHQRAFVLRETKPLPSTSLPNLDNTEAPQSKSTKNI